MIILHTLPQHLRAPKGDCSVTGCEAHLARLVLHTSAHKALIPGQEVWGHSLRMPMLSLRLRPELLLSWDVREEGEYIIYI